MSALHFPATPGQDKATDPNIPHYAMGHSAQIRIKSFSLMIAPGPQILTGH